MDASSPSATRARSPEPIPFRRADTLHVHQAAELGRLVSIAAEKNLAPRIPRPRKPVLDVTLNRLDAFIIGLLFGVLSTGGLAVFFMRAGVGS